MQTHISDVLKENEQIKSQVSHCADTQHISDVFKENEQIKSQVSHCADTQHISDVLKENEQIKAQVSHALICFKWHEWFFPLRWHPITGLQFNIP